MTADHPLKWRVVPDPERKGYEHVVPTNDTRPHELVDCWCQPFVDGFAYGHNSHDHREDYFENGTRKVH